MNSEEKNKIIFRMIVRVKTGLSFVEEYLARQPKDSGPDTAYLRSIYIVFSFHFEILLKSRLVAMQSFRDKNDLDNKLKKVGHNIKVICAELGDDELQKINIKKISLVNGEYIIKTTDKTINVKDFNDIRYDFIEGKIRSVKRDENLKITESVEGAYDILNKILIENKKYIKI